MFYWETIETQFYLNFLFHFSDLKSQFCYWEDGKIVF